MSDSRRRRNISPLRTGADNATGMRFLIPKEHGAWAMLLVPFFIGLIAAGRWQVQAIMLLAAILSLYASRYPLVLWARSRFEMFPQGGLFTSISSLIIGLSLGAVLVFRFGLWFLIPLAGTGLLLLMAHLMLVRHRRERTEAGEFLGIATLALTAPAAYYTSTGDMSILAFFLWFLGVAYSGVSVFYVKMKLAYSSPRPRPSKREGRSLILALVFYQTITIGSIVLLSSLALLPLWTIMAFAPITVQVVAGTVKRGRPFNVRRLGFILVGQSTGFVILIAAAFSLAR